MSVTDPLVAAAMDYHSTGADHERARDRLYEQVRLSIAAGRSKAEVSRVAGISRESVYAILRVGVTGFTRETIRKISKETT